MRREDYTSVVQRYDTQAKDRPHPKVVRIGRKRSRRNVHQLRSGGGFSHHLPVHQVKVLPLVIWSCGHEGPCLSVRPLWPIRRRLRTKVGGMAPCSLWVPGARGPCRCATAVGRMPSLSLPRWPGGGWCCVWAPSPSEPAVQVASSWPFVRWFVWVMCAPSLPPSLPPPLCPSLSSSLPSS